MIIPYNARSLPALIHSLNLLIMKRILVPTDFSPAALNALNYAADMAVQLDLSVTLLHMYQVPVSLSETPTVMISVDELEKSARRRLSEAAQDLARVKAEHLVVHTEALMGDVGEELENYCRKHDPFAVVMGSTGHSALEQTLFGSTTLSAVKQISWPVMSIPTGSIFGKGIHKIGLAWDFSKDDDHLPVRKLHQLASVLKANFEVLHVGTGTTPVIHAAVEQRLSPLHPTYHFIQHADLGEGLNEYASQNNLDLLIILPRHHGFLESLFSKSHTKEVLQEARLPVMSIHE